MSVRSQLEAEIYEMYDDLDPSSKNTLRMKNFFRNMTDKEFYRYMDKFFANPNANFNTAYEPFNNPVTTGFIEKIMKKHGIPLYERVYKPYITGDTKNPPASIHPVMVVDVLIKRLKQMVATKSHSSVTNAKRDAKTNQVTGDDKTARVTDVEAYSLIVQELYACAEESFGPMADDSAAMFEMLRLIQRDGEVSIKDLPKNPTNRMTMNTVFFYCLGSGVTTNMIDQSGYLLPITLDMNEDRNSSISK